MDGCPLPLVALFQQGCERIKRRSNFVGKVTDLLAEPKEGSQVCYVFRCREIADGLSKLGVRAKSSRVHHVAAEDDGRLGENDLFGVDGDVIGGCSFEEGSHQLDVFLICLGEDQDVLHHPTTAGQVVENVSYSACVVVAGVSDAEREAEILEPAERRRKCGERCRLVIQPDLVVPFEGVYHGEKFHARWDGTNGLERCGCLELWANDAPVQLTEVDAEPDSAVLFRHQNDRVDPGCRAVHFPDDPFLF